MRNSKQILVASLKEIEAGKWICGDLCNLPDNFTKDVAKPKDLMGCALGLVSIYGEDTRTSTLYSSNPITGVGHYVQCEVAEYATRSSPAAVLRAIHALFLATPKKYQEAYSFIFEADDLDSIVESLNSAVYSYNDSVIGDGYVTKKSKTNAAKRWFEKAIAILPDVPVPAPRAALETVKLEKSEDLALAS